jgi:lipopolysaccharide biosynthesis glycosyltransferase
MENAQKERRYCFFLLYNDISEININLLKKQIVPYRAFSIKFVNVPEYFKEINFFVSRHITVESYFRLLIPYLFIEYPKVLYLDGDMICRADIASLLDINLENYPLAAVRDTDVCKYFCKDDAEYIKAHHVVLPNLKDPVTYFNAGLIVFNTEKFRELISLEELLKLALSRKWNVHDQDVLNFLAGGKALLLPYHWNFMYPDKPYKSDFLPENLLREYRDAEKNPNIIHYKPWSRENYIPFFECFWKYAASTPFINIIVERMKAKGLISYDFQEVIISNITHRRGLGLRFILRDCVKAWLFRDKKA